jgi:hypothetical protein
MTRSARSSPRRPGLQRPLASSLRAALGVASLALLPSLGCGDDPAPAPPVAPDAGPACQRGTLGCGCIGGSGCEDDLLCIAGRCSLTQRDPAESLPPRPRPPPPDLDLPEPDAGSEPARPDAGAADASVPDDGPAAADAGADAG